MLQAHEFATLFPPMLGGERANLKADIKANGVKVPIWIFEGKILDGVHRYTISDELDIECPTRAFNGSRDEALDHVVSLNVKRRHLNASQRALIATEFATRKEGAAVGNRNAAKTGLPKDRDGAGTIVAAAKAFNVSRSSVIRANALKREAPPEVIIDVLAGRKTINTALNEVRSRQTLETRPMRLLLTTERIALLRRALQPFAKDADNDVRTLTRGIILSLDYEERRG